jgi:hypothetical protein
MVQVVGLYKTLGSIPTIMSETQKEAGAEWAAALLPVPYITVGAVRFRPCTGHMA